MRSKLNENDKLAWLQINEIVPNPGQPRKKFNEETIKELADSIDATGHVHPIVVRKYKGDKHQIVAGERRWKACKKIGIKEMPVIIRDIPENEVDIHSFVENWHREELTNVEKEDKMYELYGRTQSDRYEGKNSLQQLATELGISVETVRQYLINREIRHQLKSRKILESVITDSISFTIMTAVRPIKDLDYKAKFIEALYAENSTLPDDLRLNNKALQRAAKIFANAPNKLKDAVLAGRLRIEDVDRQVEILKEVEQETGKPLADVQVQKATEIAIRNRLAEEEQKSVDKRFEKTVLKEQSAKQQQAISPTAGGSGDGKKQSSASQQQVEESSVHYEAIMKYLDLKKNLQQLMYVAGINRGKSETQQGKDLEMQKAWMQIFKHQEDDKDIDFLINDTVESTIRGLRMIQEIGRGELKSRRNPLLSK